MPFCQSIKETARKYLEGEFLFTQMSGAGSARTFYRFETPRNKKAVLIIWDGKDSDWDYFIALNEILELQNSIPSIIEFKREENWAFVRDCGNFTLKNLFEIHKNNIEEKKNLLDKTAQKLAFWQSVKIPQTNIISKRIFAMPDLLWESDYFRKHISPIFPNTKDLFFSDNFEKERNEIAAQIDKQPKCLMHRDFQSENIVFDENNVSFVDIQGARLGPRFYDVASLLFDPYLYPMITQELRSFFVGKLQIQKDNSLFLCALQRLMQAIGAYGNLSQNQNKPHYRQFIKPAAIQAFDICKTLDKYQTLSRIFKKIAEK
ncbi:MAG: aminoglycoside phosphotransferase family protein [Chitinispirillales bacterium]|jgi:aminoglycoside/choline kinase family phosphotransferase|nr:aminoglycoside phosphotransferase family protein [Chitinispirillales bacterium]